MRKARTNAWSDAFSTTPRLAAALGDEALTDKMLAFEAALGRALSKAGVAPDSAARAIADACSRIDLDLDALFEDGARAGTLAIPLVKALTAEVRAVDASAAAFVHFGATSQDVVDTAFVLQLRDAHAAIEADLDRLGDAAARLTRTHRRTAMLGRTLLQPASPIPFGLKTAQWLGGASDARARLRRSAKEGLVVQFGGAAGSLGSLGPAGEAVARHLNEELSPGASGFEPPWHARRARLIGYACDLALVVGVCAKIARDVSLLMQFEVGEAAEPVAAGRGGSSAMPHKRNPVLCMFTLAAASRAPQLAATLLGAMAQEHERALGGWQAEWAAYPELAKLAGGAAGNMAETLEGLTVDPQAMRANLDSLRGLPMTEFAALDLAADLGKSEAHAAVEAAARTALKDSVPLADALMRDPRITAVRSAAAVEAMVAPERAEGSAQAIIDRALSRWSERDQNG